MKKVFLFVLYSVLFSPVAFSQTLTTKNFIVEVTQSCPEGHVTCDIVKYVGTSKKTGDSIELKGTTLHSMCADGVTPCRFLGYEFKNGNITYRVLEEGLLQVTKNGSKVLLEEKGEWSR